MISDLKENVLSKNSSVKVRSFPGSTVDDMLFHVVPVLKKQPGYLIIHIGTNDATNSTSTEILDSS